MPSSAGPGQQAIPNATRAIPATYATGVATPTSSSPSNSCPTKDGTTSKAIPVAISARAAKVSTFFITRIHLVLCPQVALKLPGSLWRCACRIAPNAAATLDHFSRRCLATDASSRTVWLVACVLDECWKSERNGKSDARYCEYDRLQPTVRKRFGVTMAPEVPMTIQERGYTSPI
jgi:hypothetical protein